MMASREMPSSSMTLTKSSWPKAMGNPARQRTEFSANMPLTRAVARAEAAMIKAADWLGSIIPSTFRRMVRNWWKRFRSVVRWRMF